MGSESEDTNVQSSLAIIIGSPFAISNAGHDGEIDLPPRTTEIEWIGRNEWILMAANA